MSELHPPASPEQDPRNVDVLAGDAGVDPDDRPPGRFRTLRRFRRHRRGMVGAIFLLIIAVAAIAAPWIAPKDPNEQDLLNRIASPGGDFLLGTDGFGRDQLSRLIFGARVSLTVGFGSMAVAFALGAPLGVLAGFRGGKIDAFLSRCNDALLALPALLFFFAIIAVMGRSLLVLCGAIGLFSSTGFFRIARAGTHAASQETYIESTRAIGATTWRLVLRHIVPNILSPLLVLVSIGAGVAVTAEASLSFLGLGIQPPTASWGGMLSTGSSYMQQSPALIYAPSVMIALTVLSFGMVGDGLRAAVGTTRVAVTEGT